MPYTKTTWVDEVPAASPVKYSITGDFEGEISASATIEIVTSVSPEGTPVNASNLNKIEEGIETAQETAEEALDTAEAAIPKSIFTAAGDLLYGIGSALYSILAKPSVDALLKMSSTGIPSWKTLTQILPGTTAGDIDYYTGNQVKTRLAKPSKTSILQETSGGVPSWRKIALTVQVQVIADDTEVSANDEAYFFIPELMDNMNLVRAQGMVLTAGTTGALTIQLRNMTKYPTVNILSTAISIASGATVGTEGSIYPARDDVSTDDQMRIQVVTTQTTKPKGLFVILEYEFP